MQADRRRTGQGLVRVLVMSAEVGAGHVTTARALADSLGQRPQAQAIKLRSDLEVMGQRMGRFMARGFESHLDGIGRSRLTLGRLRYELAYRVFFEQSRPRQGAHLALAALAGPGLRATIAGFRPDVVVTEFPVLSAALGQLRAMGRLPVPVCSAISDPAGLWYWAHPGIDLHLVSWPEAVAEVEWIAGPGRAAAVRPVVDGRILRAPSRAEARLRLGLSESAPVIVISGGGWGVGDLAGATRASLAAAPGGQIICLAGRSADTRRLLLGLHQGDPRVRVLGFTDRMPELLAAADVVIHTTGGTTALETRVTGCRLINFGRSVAHVRTHAQMMHRHGLAEWAPTVRDLGPAVNRALGEPPPPRLQIDQLPEAADLVLQLALERSSGSYAPPGGDQLRASGQAELG